MTISGKECTLVVFDEFVAFGNWLRTFKEESPDSHRHQKNMTTSADYRKRFNDQRNAHKRELAYAMRRKQYQNEALF